MKPVHAAILALFDTNPPPQAALAHAELAWIAPRGCEEAIEHLGECVRLAYGVRGHHAEMLATAVLLYVHLQLFGSLPEEIPAR